MRDDLAHVYLLLDNRLCEELTTRRQVAARPRVHPRSDVSDVQGDAWPERTSRPPGATPNALIVGTVGLCSSDDACASLTVAIKLADVRRLVREPPEALGTAGRSLYVEVRRDWKLRPDEERLLLAACRTCDELERMERALATTDPVVTGSKGQERAHPLIAEVRAHRLALRQLFTALGIREAIEGEHDGTARSHAGRQLARRRWGSRVG